MHYTEMSQQLDYVLCYLHNRYPMAETHILHVARQREKEGGREREKETALEIYCLSSVVHILSCL